MYDEEEEDQFCQDLVMGFVVSGVEGLVLPSSRGGSCLGIAHNIKRDRDDIHQRMMRDYFCNIPMYGPCFFVVGTKCNGLCYCTLWMGVFNLVSTLCIN